MMRRVENHRLVGVPLGVFIEGHLIVGTSPCNSKSCKKYYENFDICGGNYGVTDTGQSMCGFSPAGYMLMPRWRLRECEE